MHHPLRPATAESATVVDLHRSPAHSGEPGDALLAMADPGTDCRIAILAPGALELGCALLRRGYSEVAMMQVCDRPRQGQADIVVIPQVASVEAMRAAVGCARRMLAPLGTVVMRLVAGPEEITVESAMRELAVHGCAVVRKRFVFGDIVLRAELPLYGQLKCA